MKRCVIAMLLIASASLAIAREPELLTTGPATQPLPLVTIQEGNLPIILSAPHGGRLPIPGATTRTGDNSPKRRGAKTNFSFAFDRNVDVLALRLADELEKRTGKRPYVVIANFGRRYVDANRDPADAYESDAGQAVYEQYHDALVRFRRDITKQYNCGLILDLHGHGGDADTLIRGTADWASVTHLVEAFGKESVTGEKGLLGPIAKAGFDIRPLNAETTREVPSLNGGFITRHYGSFAGGSFDAIQFELGNAYRTKEGIDRFAPVLADSLVAFMDGYLPGPKESTTQPTTDRAAD